MKRLSDLIDKLIWKSFIHPVVYSIKSKVGKPGEIIERLSKEDRELLKEAKAKDFYHRIK